MLRSRTPFGGSDSCSVAIATTTSLEIEERILNKVYDFFIFKHVNVFYADLNSVVDQCCYIFYRWIRSRSRSRPLWSGSGSATLSPYRYHFDLLQLKYTSFSTLPAYICTDAVMESK